MAANRTKGPRGGWFRVVRERVEAGDVVGQVLGRWKARGMELVVDGAVEAFIVVDTDETSAVG